MSRSWMLKSIFFVVIILSGALIFSSYWPTFSSVDRMFDAGSNERRLLVLKIHEWFAVTLIFFTFVSLTIKIISRKAPIKTALFLALQLLCLLRIYQTPWYRVAFWDSSRSMLGESRKIDIDLQKKIPNLSREVIPIREEDGTVTVYPSYPYQMNPYLGGVRDYLRWHYFYIPGAMLILILVSILPWLKRRRAA